jgi:hypothetical protein
MISFIFCSPRLEIDLPLLIQSSTDIHSWYQGSIAMFVRAVLRRLDRVRYKANQRAVPSLSAVHGNDASQILSIGTKGTSFLRKPLLPEHL